MQFIIGGPTDNNPEWVEVMVVLSAYTITGDIQIRFVVDKSAGSPFYDDLIIDDVYVEEAPTCPAPAALGVANLTQNSADLTWTSFSGLSDIEFGLAGFTPTGVPTYAGVTSPYPVSGLTGVTSYSFYVRDDCGGGDYSLWTGPYTFLTMPATTGIPVYEDFENGFVYFDNAPGNNINWTINTSYYHNGIQCAHNAYNSTNANILHETSVLDLSSAAVVFLEFWQIAKAEGNYDHCVIEISTDGGTTYTPLPLDTYQGSGNYHVPTANAPYDICFDEDSYAIWGTGSEIPDNATWWQLESFDLSNYLTTNVRIRFRIDTDGSIARYGWLLDEILIYEPAYGTLAGIVTDASNSAPIEGATITVGSLSTTTGIDGTYNLPGILIGTWNANCTAVGYNPASASITIIEDQTTTQDFSLTAPQIVVNPLTVAVEIQPNAQTDETVNIANPGNGPLDWNASLVLLSEETKAPWDLQFSFDVTAASGAAGNAGAECDGDFYYTTRWASGLIHKYDLTGNLIEEFSIPGVTGLRDLAYDGTHFYGGAAATTIYQMDFVNKVLIGTISSPVAVRNIAYDEGQDGFWVANWDTDIVLVSKAGVTIATLPASVHLLGGMYGSAFDNWSAGGPYLWIFDQGAGAGTPQLVHQANLNTITMTGFTHDVTADLPPNASAIAGGLFTIPNVITGTVSLGGLIQGTPDVLFMLELASYSTWLTITPTSGSLAAGTNEDMILHFDATDLLPGVYMAEIHFGSNPNVGSPIVGVTMTVAGLIPATNLALTFDCTDVELTWEMPTGGNPDSWNVYKDGILLSNSTIMAYTDEMVMTNVEYSYYVTAVYAGEESMPSNTESITVPVPGNLQPLGLVANANTPSYGYVTLDWNEPNACLEPDGYHIYRDNVQITTTPVTELTYVDGPLGSGLYEYKLKAAYYFGESGFSSPAYALIPVGIEETVDNVFSIFPNPASQMVNINSAIEITSISVINGYGQLIMSREIKNTDCQIDVSKYEKGVYYIRLVAGETKFLKKVTVH
jgi:hypothetical protein